MDVVFNINNLAMEGLGATLSSLIRNCSNNEELKLWFLCSDLEERDKDNIKWLLKYEGFKGDIEYVDFNARQIFGHLRSLHGDWTTYGRLLIANYIKSDTALYLDADLVILLDVLCLKEFKLENNILAAVYGSSVKEALEGQFFLNKLNFRSDTSYFNAGVILFNLKKWRSDDIDKQWKLISEQYPNDLLSVDQTLLNAVCNGRFDQLPQAFNIAWYAFRKKPEEAGNGIIHFIGSPKPWDILGRTIHEGYDIWNAYNTSFWKKKYNKMTLNKVKRTWNIRRSLVRNLSVKLVS